MVEEKDSIKEFTFTVHCVNGEKIIHKYEVYQTEELQKIINALDMLKNVLEGKASILFFTNPDIYYNLKNVVGIETSTVSKEQIETLIKEAQKSIGFKKV